MLVGLVLGLGWYAGYTYYFKGRQESLRIKENQLEALLVDLAMTNRAIREREDS